jgi:hypothetical protein
MVAHGRVELLAHPLSQKYLKMKWDSYGKYFHLANLLLYTIFLAFVTSFVAQLMSLPLKENANTTDNKTSKAQQHQVGLKKIFYRFGFLFCD